MINDIYSTIFVNVVVHDNVDVDVVDFLTLSTSTVYHFLESSKIHDDEANHC